MNIAVTLDINKPEAGQRIRLRRGEVNSTVLSFVVNEGGVRVDLTGFTEVLFCAQKDDGIIIDTLTVSEEGECMYSLPASLASIAGEVRLAYLELRKEGYRATTDTVIFEVLEAVNSDEVAASYVPKLDNLIDDINEFRSEVEAEEATRKSNEEARVEAEKGRVSAESKRVEAESKRVTAESERATAESGRVTAEKGRVSAETARDSAEDARATAESERASAETTREQNETTRKSNESSRVTAEELRDDAEADRVTAEKGRVTAETSRASAEDAREVAEADRVSAETGRVSAESGRVNAESSRTTAESARDDAEDARASAETSRANAESARATAESGRVSAESARVQAENKRQADFAEIVDAAQGFKTQLLVSGQYDPDTLVPSITGNPGIIYLVPVGDGATGDDHYKEFLYLSNAWEYIGTTNTTITPISTDTIDEILAEQTKTGSETLNTTGLSYFFSSLWSKAKGAFADIVHKHAASDITSGTLDDDRLPVVPVSKGGTGASTAAEAANNLAVSYLGVPYNAIPEGADLDDYVTPGCYGVPSGVVAATLVNTPVTDVGFSLEVSFYTNGFGQQKIYVRNGKVHCREIVNGHVNGDWKLTPANANGVTPISYGGTGTTNAAAARYNLLNGMPDSSDSALSDASLFVGKSITGTSDAVYSRTALTVWNYIKSKITGGGIAPADIGAATEAQAVPTGGTAGQLLTKTADSFGWADAPDGLPDGGATGQVLTKTDSGFGWQDTSGGQPQAGVIYPYGGDSAAVPYGYLLCDGSAVSRTTYASLFAVVGTAYGEGDGSTTFNLPDLRARVAVGEGNITDDSGPYEFWRGDAGGEVMHKLTANEMPSHSHSAHSLGVDSGSLNSNASMAWTAMRSNNLSAHVSTVSYTANTGGGQAHMNMPPFAVVNYIISTGMTGSQAEALANITIGTDEAPATGVPGSIYIQML